MPRMRISFLVVLCLLFVATRADSGAEQDDALEVARLAMSPRVYDFMIAQMNETLIMTVDRLRTDGKKTPPEAAKKLKEALPRALPRDALISWAAEIYSRHFTRAELHDLAAFYSTPLGTKLVGEVPQIMDEFSRKITAEYQPRMRAALQER